MESENKKINPFVQAGIIVFFLFVMLALVGSSGNNNQVSNQPGQIITVGDSVVFDAGEDVDSILLAVDESVSQELMKAIVNNDQSAIVKMGADGRVFAAFRGAKGEVLDTKISIIKVKLTEGPSGVNQNNLGRSGWVPREWIRK